MPESLPEEQNMFPEQAHLRLVDASLNKNRYYFITIQPTLFGDADLTCEWGRIGSPGTVKRIRHTDAGAAVNTIHTIVERRLRRGYIHSP